MTIKITNKLPVGFSKAPLLKTPLAKLPLGSIIPRGWLKHQLDLMAAGLVGQLCKISPFLKPENGWFGGNNPGWEEQPYWFRGFHDLAVLTGDEKLLAEARTWIEAVIESQDEEGYFGAKYHKAVAGKNGQVVTDLWPHMVMLDAVISHYEHTHDERVIPMMTRFFRFCEQLPESRFIPSADWKEFGDWKPSVQVDRAGDMLPHIFWLYEHTGEKWLLDLATRFYLHTAPPKGEWLDDHIVNFTQRFSYPGIYYRLSKESCHLAQSEYWYTQHMAVWGQQARGIFAADERIRPGCVDPRQAFETCGMVEFAKSFYMLGRITGETKYADRTEDIMLNHFAASQTPDLKSLKYLTASNQPQLDASKEHEYRNKGRQICYSPHIYRCCQHNVAMGWPWYVQNLWQATADKGLAAWLYASSEAAVKVGRHETEVKIISETGYPFNGMVQMTVQSSAKVSFPLYLRIPGWCRKFNVALNGKALGFKTGPGAYACIDREWSPGDKITIDMAMEIGLTQWPRNGSVTVERGPLSYSVKIGERWQRCGGTDEWPEWEVFPTTPWNYGLVVDRDNPAGSFKVAETGKTPDQPWMLENAPVEITARAKKIPNWKLQNETVSELQQSPVKSEEPEETIRMIPLGCARLRMACLPVIGDGQTAREWK